MVQRRLVATLFSPGALEHRIHKLDPATQAWVDTGVTVDRRGKVRTDALWDAAAGKLYVASHLHTTTGKSTVARKAGASTATATTRRRAVRAGRGLSGADQRGAHETLVIAKDSTGTLWATWTQDGRVYVNHPVGGDDAVWGTPYLVPGAGALTTDDISSDRPRRREQDRRDVERPERRELHFAVHEDGAADGAWSASIVPTGGPRADDHINLKADGAGRVYAAVKTAKGGTGSTPTIFLLVRSPAGASFEPVRHRKRQPHPADGPAR